MPRSKTSALLIEDSGFMRIVLSDVLKTDPDINLLGTATNGKVGIDKIRQLQPEVVITDMVMPESDGLVVVKEIMKQDPRPIILLSSLDKEDPKIFEALAAGAFDFLNKEEVASLAKQGQFPLNDMVKAAARSSFKRSQKDLLKKNTYAHSFDSQMRYEVIAIGASTGGPAAIESLLLGLPNNLTIPVVIAQHMPEHFLHSFAKRLNKLSPLNVKIAERGEALQGGSVYVLPGHTNCRVIRDASTNQPVFSYTKRQYSEFNHPSVDGLFLSIADTFSEKVIGVVLTGMGKDGTEGMKSIHKNRGFTIAQDEPSSVVFGMPKSAIENKVINQVLPLKEISGFVVSCLS